MCGQLHDYVRKAHPLYAILTFSGFLCWAPNHPILQRAQRMHITTNRKPNWSGTLLKKLMRQECLRCWSLWGICFKTWANWQVVILATIGHQLQRRFRTENSPMYQRYPKISRNVSVLAGVTRHVIVNPIPYHFDCFANIIPFGSCSKQQPTETQAQQNQVDSFRLFVFVQATVSPQTVTLSLSFFSSLWFGHLKYHLQIGIVFVLIWFQ